MLIIKELTTLVQQYSALIELVINAMAIIGGLFWGATKNSFMVKFAINYY
jgi:hypothetical protein